MIRAELNELVVNMAKTDMEFDIETPVDLDNIDEAAAAALEKRAEKSAADEIEVVEVGT